jgi:hypothetical protein
MLNLLRCSVDLDAVFTIPDDTGGEATGGDVKDGSDAKKGAVAKPVVGKYTYRFCGMICYYGQHYVSLFARRSQDKRAAGHGDWLLFDDAHIRSLGGWREVKRFCARAKYQPTVVWFERVPLGEAPWWEDDDENDDDVTDFTGPATLVRGAQPKVPVPPKGPPPGFASSMAASAESAAKATWGLFEQGFQVVGDIGSGVKDAVEVMAQPLVGEDYRELSLELRADGVSISTKGAFARLVTKIGDFEVGRTEAGTGAWATAVTVPRDILDDFRDYKVQVFGAHRTGATEIDETLLLGECTVGVEDLLRARSSRFAKELHVAAGTETLSIPVPDDARPGQKVSPAHFVGPISRAALS